MNKNCIKLSNSQIRNKMQIYLYGITIIIKRKISTLTIINIRVRLVELSVRLNNTTKRFNTVFVSNLSGNQSTVNS